MEIINWLDSHTGSVTVLATVVTAIATVAVAVANIALALITRQHVRLTHDILEDNQQMRLEAQTPQIVVYLDSYTDSWTHVDLYVENTGPASAYDIRFRVDLSTVLGYNYRLEEVIFLRTGIGFLASGQHKTYKLGRADQLDLDALQQQPLQIGVAYKNEEGKEYQNDFSLDFREHFGG